MLTGREYSYSRSLSNVSHSLMPRTCLLNTGLMMHSGSGELMIHPFSSPIPFTAEPLLRCAVAFCRWPDRDPPRRNRPPPSLAELRLGIGLPQRLLSLYWAYSSPTNRDYRTTGRAQRYPDSSAHPHRGAHPEWQRLWQGLTAATLRAASSLTCKAGSPPANVRFIRADPRDPGTGSRLD